MHLDRMPGIMPALSSVLVALLLFAGTAAAASAQHHHRATCNLEIVGSGGAFAAVLERGTADPDSSPDESFRVATRAQAPANLRSISLRCRSPQGPITVGASAKLITSKHLQGFAGVEVVDGTNMAKACGLAAWSGARPEPQQNALLFFCGDFHVDFDEISIRGVQLMHQLSKQRRSYLLVFGGGDGSNVTAAIHQAQIINSTADSAVLVAGTSRVNISRLHCSGTMGRSGACLSASNAAVVHLQHSHIINCSAAWGGGVAVSDNATFAIHNSTFVGCGGVRGGAVDVAGSTSLSVTGSRFVSNTALSEDASTTAFGGALAVWDDATASLFHSSLVKNSANKGGAIACVCSPLQSCKLEIVNGTFTDNTAAGFGGAVNAWNAVVMVSHKTCFTRCSAGGGGGAVEAGATAAVSVIDSNFTACNARDGDGGAIEMGGNTSLIVNDSNFLNNSARDGGAILCSCDYLYVCSVRLGSCVVQGNNASVNSTTAVGGTGGGIAVFNARVAIADSHLLNNTAWTSGGAIAVGTSMLTLDRTKVAFNNASNEQLSYPGYGGGVWCSNSNVTVTGCNMSFNTAWDAGGGVRASDSNVTVVNSTMLNNTCPGSGSAGGLLFVWGTGAAPLEVVFGDNNTIHGSSAVSGGALHVSFNSTAAADSATSRSKIIVNGNVSLQNNSASFGQDVIVIGRPFLHVNGSNLCLNNSSVMRQDVCAVGDSRSADGYCALCPAQMLSLDPNYTQPCQPCPNHARCVGGAVVVAGSGFYNSGNLGGNCTLSTIIRCPNPLACQHITSAVALQHPYFTYMTTIKPLSEAANWTNYTSGLCDTGYRGLLCGNCQDKFGQTDAFSCSACLRSKDGGINTAGIWGLLLLYSVLFVVVVWATIAMNMLEHNSHASGGFSRGDTAFQKVGLFTTRRASADDDDDDELQLTDVIKALIVYAQYFAGIIAKLPVAWPDVLAVPLEQLSESWSRAMGASASLDCVLPSGIDPVGLKALINLFLMPTAVFLTVLFCQTVWWACKRQRMWLLATFGRHVCKLLWPDGSPASSASARKIREWCIQVQFYASRSSSWLRGVSGLREYLRHRWVVSCLVTLFFFYPSVVRVAVGMFTCITVCGQRYWVMNVEKPCPLVDPTSPHGHWAFGVGIPAMLVLVAVPVSVAWLLWVAVHKDWLDEPWFQQRFGFMFSNYQSQVADKHSRPDRWSQLLVTAKQRVILAWDAVIHMQTVVLVFMSVFGLMMHEYWQTLILAAVFGSYLLLVLWLQPFRGRYAQRLQTQSTAVLFVTCCLVLTFIPPEGMDEQQSKGYKRTAGVTGVLLLALNIVFVAYGLVLLLPRLLSKMLQVVFTMQRTAGPRSSNEHRRVLGYPSFGTGAVQPHP